MDGGEQEHQKQRGQSPSKNLHDKDEDNGGDKTEDLLRNLDKGKKAMQVRPVPDEGNVSPKKVKVWGSDLGLGRPGSSGAKYGAQRSLWYGNVGSSSSSSVEIRGFGSGANIGVQSCLSRQVDTYLFGQKIGEPGSGANNGAKSCLSREADHYLFGQKIGEPWSDIFGARSDAGVKIVESGSGATRNNLGATGYVCGYCGKPCKSGQALGGHMSRCKKIHEAQGGEAKEAGSSGSGPKRYEYNPARGGYVCKDCDMKFDTPHGLNSHMSKRSCKKGEEATLDTRVVYVCQYFPSHQALGGHMGGCKKRQQAEGRWRW